MTKADLIEVATRVQQVADNGDYDTAYHLAVYTVPTLVTELLIAREIIAQVRLQSRPHVYLCKAVAAYDQAMEVKP